MTRSTSHPYNGLIQQGDNRLFNFAQIRPCIDKRNVAGAYRKATWWVTPVFHSDQGWQYQHAEYQRYLKEHNIVQSMSRKSNCMDNEAMENFFGRLQVEMFYAEKFETVDKFVHRLKEYIHYWNNWDNERISLKLKGMSPVQYRTHYHTIYLNFVQTLGFTSN